MREYEEYHQILALWELGIAKKRIAITLNIPRATVRDCIERYRSVKGLQENRE
ncbi:MAG: helix-turn-helix domain-containing protein [Chloroflexota bacterium]